jgi:hypothetical protein
MDQPSNPKVDRTKDAAAQREVRNNRRQVRREIGKE